jgi:hypothetical protein
MVQRQFWQKFIKTITQKQTVLCACNPSYLGDEDRRSQFKTSSNKASMRLYLKNKLKAKGPAKVQVVKNFLNKCEALCSITSTEKRKNLISIQKILNLTEKGKLKP